VSIDQKISNMNRKIRLSKMNYNRYAGMGATVMKCKMGPEGDCDADDILGTNLCIVLYRLEDNGAYLKLPFREHDFWLMQVCM
jgi:hypothetical protein